VSNLSSWERAVECSRSAVDKKAYDLVVLDTAKLTSIADYFVICTGRSDTQVQAIAEAVTEHLATLGVKPLSSEGLERGQWVLIDYGDVVVHVFQAPVRECAARRPARADRRAGRTPRHRHRARLKAPGCGPGSPPSASSSVPSPPAGSTS
jgi:ribosome-associated protein